MTRLRTALGAGVVVTAILVWAVRPDPRAAALAVVAVLAGLLAALLPRSDAPAFALALLVAEAALAGDRASQPDRLALALLLAVVLWCLHAGYALAAAAHAAGRPPAAARVAYVTASARLLAVAAPAVVALSLLAFLPRTTGVGSGLLRVVALAVGVAVSAIPVLLARHRRASA